MPASQGSGLTPYLTSQGQPPTPLRGLSVAGTLGASGSSHAPPHSPLAPATWPVHRCASNSCPLLTLPWGLRVFPPAHPTPPVLPGPTQPSVGFKARPSAPRGCSLFVLSLPRGEASSFSGHLCKRLQIIPPASQGMDTMGVLGPAPFPEPGHLGRQAPTFCPVRPKKPPQTPRERRAGRCSPGLSRAGWTLSACQGRFSVRGRSWTRPPSRGAALAPHQPGPCLRLRDGSGPALLRPLPESLAICPPPSGCWLSPGRRRESIY